MQTEFMFCMQKPNMQKEEKEGEVEKRCYQNNSVLWI